MGGNRYLVSFIRGIATPVCALVRNDSKERTNNNLYVYRLFGDYFLIDIPWGLGYTDRSTVRIAGKKGDFIMTVREIADS